MSWLLCSHLAHHWYVGHVATSLTILQKHFTSVFRRSISCTVTVISQWYEIVIPTHMANYILCWTQGSNGNSNERHSYISPWVYTQVQCPCVSLCRKSWSQHYRNLPSRTLKEFFTYQLYVHFDIEPKGSGAFHSLSIGRKFELSHVIFFKALFATLWSIQDMMARLLLQKDSGYCRIKTIYSIFLKKYDAFWTMNLLKSDLFWQIIMRL